MSSSWDATAAVCGCTPIGRSPTAGGVRAARSCSVSAFARRSELRRTQSAIAKARSLNLRSFFLNNFLPARRSSGVGGTLWLLGSLILLHSLAEQVRDNF